MPGVRRVRKNSQPAPSLSGSGTAVAELEAPSPGATEDTERPYDAGNETIPFFDALRRLTRAQWEQHLVYLYRVDPKVKNAGQYKYIDKFSQAFDEDDIKQEHGGGTYQAILKNTVTDEEVRKFVFAIEGLPKLQDGQTLVKPNVAATPAPEVLPQQPSDIKAIASVFAENMKLILENTRDKSPEEATKISMELMQTAMRNALDVQKQAITQQSSSTTGHPLVDKFLERAIANLDKTERSARNPIEEKLLDFAMQKLVNGDGGSGSALLTQLGEIKETLGLDLAELLKGRSGKGDWSSRLVDIAGEAVKQLPVVAQQYFAVRQVELDKALQLENLRAVNIQNAMRLRGLEPATPAPIAAPTVPSAAPVPAQTVPTTEDNVQMFDSALEFLADLYEGGMTGDAAARLARKQHPAAIAMLMPYTTNFDQLLDWCKAHEPLRTFADDQDFPAFVREFVDELNGIAPAGDAPAGGTAGDAS